MIDVVHKYKFVKRQGEFTLDLLMDSKVLHVAIQDGHRTMWVRERGLAQGTRLFCVVGTGDTLPPTRGASWQHVGTFFEGPYVWHVFDGGLA